MADGLGYSRNQKTCVGLQMKELVLDASTCDDGCKYVRLYKALLAQELPADPGMTNLSKEGG